MNSPTYLPNFFTTNFVDYGSPSFESRDFPDANRIDNYIYGITEQREQREDFLPTALFNGITDGLNVSGSEEPISAPAHVVRDRVMNILESAKAEEELNNILEENEDDVAINKETRKRQMKKSSLTYKQMAFLAIFNSPKGVLSLHDIYTFIRSNFLSLGGNWQNSVRSSLTNRRLFQRVKFRDSKNVRQIVAYQIVSSSTSEELKSVQKVIETKGFESLRMKSKAPIEKLFEVKAACSKHSLSNMQEILPQIPFESISTELFLAMREHSYDIEEHI